MKSRLSRLVLSSAFLVVLPLFAALRSAATEAVPPTGRLTPVTAKEAAWAAKERKAYPLEVCLTSDEKLGSMGKSPEYVYRVDGQPDRLVVFCCAGCDEDFLKEPAKYLAKLEAAAKSGAKAGGGNRADAHHGHR